MATKLNQIIAIANSRKTENGKAITAIYQQFQKQDLFSGFARVYRPLDDADTEVLQPEKKVVQLKVDEQLDKAKTKFVETMNVIATQEYANCHAVADIVVGDKVIAKNVPVTYMLFIEKQLDDITTLLNSIPTLPNDVVWHKSEHQNGIYVSDQLTTNRTKKVPKAFVKAPATDKHPAQVDVFNEDIIVGHWIKTDMSSAIPQVRKDELLMKVKVLKDAVKMAREAANSIEVKDIKVGNDIISYIFE